MRGAFPRIDALDGVDAKEVQEQLAQLLASDTDQSIKAECFNLLWTNFNLLWKGFDKATVEALQGIGNRLPRFGDKTRLNIYKAAQGHYDYEDKDLASLSARFLARDLSARGKADVVGRRLSGDYLVHLGYSRYPPEPFAIANVVKKCLDSSSGSEPEEDVGVKVKALAYLGSLDSQELMTDRGRGLLQLIVSTFMQRENRYKLRIKACTALEYLAGRAVPHSWPSQTVTQYIYSIKELVKPSSFADEDGRIRACAFMALYHLHNAAFGREAVSDLGGRFHMVYQGAESDENPLVQAELHKVKLKIGRFRSSSAAKPKFPLDEEEPEE